MQNITHKDPDRSSRVVDSGFSVSGSVVDLFCGAGGLTHGFHLEGFNVAAGIDVDASCRFAYEHNNSAPFFEKDVASLTASELAGMFSPSGPKILVGCAPCQPFSSYNQKNEDPKYKLVEKFAELICDIEPDIVSMENVPRLLAFQGGKVFDRFLKMLEKHNYSVDKRVIYAPDYGVAQSRSRLVLVASRLGPIRFIAPTHTPDSYSTVREAIGDLPVLKAGEIDERDPMHRASRLSEINLKRIRASRPGGSWKDWDDKLVAKCHQNKSGDGYVSVYGRMTADDPSPTITTQFFGFGNGRFGHPEQDRGLSLREGAILQSFPPKYAFAPPGEPIQFKKMGRMIGNAVPVLLAQAIARSVKIHLNEIASATP
ncbi:DNA cytosine methyltransferase [Rhizobium sp. CECT 9324]|uniref:DNA cytosine methyltransferase n=1 Tax=Rhizobium sp. CECT 9324 TaxID=2845820 RepID=UPI001E60164D|nr:DNA cytosine methyltransferase [Rhizobium sp. CECT 9324]CAH0343562.1 putative BsuMI modification methylase subunit YdiO [Rhizobium sp. CECT 9324]